MNENKHIFELLKSKKNIPVDLAFINLVVIECIQKTLRFHVYELCFSFFLQQNGLKSRPSSSEYNLSESFPLICINNYGYTINFHDA